MKKSRLPYFVAKKSMEQGGKRINQEEIAEATGLTQATISRWMSEKPIQRFDIDTAEVLADWVGCKWHEMVEEIADPELMTEAAQLIA